MRTPTEQPLNGGIQRLYDFDNGYQASVVKHDYSYGGAIGLWELAVICDEQIVYDTPVTDGVIGNIPECDIEVILDRIEQLPNRTTPNPKGETQMASMKSQLHDVTGIKIRLFVLDEHTDKPFNNVSIEFKTPDGTYKISALDTDALPEFVR